MAFIIGLGGSGVRFVQTLIEQENPIFDGALTFDNTSADEAAGSHSPSLQHLGTKWKHVCLASEKSTLESVINAGVDVSFQSDNSQLALKQLASWRPSKEFINLPLDMGAGSIRAVGRSISIASTHVLQTELAQIQKDDICLVASTDGSTGSTLLIDVLEILNRTAPKARLTIVALNSIVVKGVSDIAHCANSVATLCELQTYFAHYLNKAPSQIHPFGFEFPGSRSLFVVNRQDSDQVKFAIDQLPNWKKAPNTLIFSPKNKSRSGKNLTKLIAKKLINCITTPNLDGSPWSVAIFTGKKFKLQTKSEIQ